MQDRPQQPGPKAAPRAPRLLVVLGPTATGKSDLALSLAERLDGEIVGCDALQVYRHFDAGTAKPTARDRLRAPHHLLDHVEPSRDYSLADYVDEAGRAIAEIRGRGRVPLVVGGTGMYLRGLLRGIVDAPPRDSALRERLRRVGARRGTPSLHRWLSRRDPASAVRISPNDAQRVIRALELALGGGSTWSERLRRQGTWNGETERYATLKIGLELERGALNRRLDERVDRFFATGLVEEVRRLLACGVPREANAFKAIGYREIVDALVRGVDPEGAREEIKRNTRRLAKRQRAWYRKETGVIWLDVARPLSETLEQATVAWRCST